MLTDLAFPRVMDTSSSDLIGDFFSPALQHSVRYDRGVGFFSSGWLRIAAKGMARFAENDGKARWITSPILSEADWNALRTGDAARSNIHLREILVRNIGALEETLNVETLSALAWLVADGILTFKIALPRNKLELGEFHDKFGIFVDSIGNSVVFNGSYNDSIQGTHNYESIKIFMSWEEPFKSLIDSDIQRFNRLWTNMDPNVQVFEIPEVSESMIKLRKRPRPYKLLGGGDGSPPRSRTASMGLTSPTPTVPHQIVLRDYQLKAVESWFSAGCQGIYEMATGTGKTITALSAAARLYASNGRLLVVISCPYKHLVEQWTDEATRFGFRPIKVVESKAKWEEKLADSLRAFQKQYTNVVAVITTNKSLTLPALSSMLAEYWPEALLIVDEVHYAGAPTILNALPKSSPWRLGLSATPIRHYDRDGTEAVLDYFGDIVFSLPLAEAIGKYLTPYNYYPIPVELTDSEFAEYCALTDKLRKYMRTEDEPMSEAAQRIAIQRARVLNNSQSKLEWLRANISTYDDMSYALFYVGDKIFRDVLYLLGDEKRIRVHEFTHRVTTNKERQAILNRFARGDLQALVAMKCLDEGVDIPPTRTAYFLASSGNPREFIQRRGRILRLYEGKDQATVIDLISIPPRDAIQMGELSPDYGAVRSAIRREYRRVKEFASLAINRFSALDGMFQIASDLDLLDV